MQIPQWKGAISRGCLGHQKAVTTFGAAVAAVSLPHLLQKGSFNRQRHAAEGIIHYARQAHTGIRKIMGAGNAAYQPGMG